MAAATGVAIDGFSMKQSHTRYWLILVLTIAIPHASLHAESALDKLLEANAEEGRLNLELIASVYGEAVLNDGDMSIVLQRLNRMAEDASRSALERSKSYLSVAHLQWRLGHYEQSLDVAQRAQDAEETVDGRLLRARLLDAKGHEEEAAELYREVFNLSADDAEREFVRIRLTMMRVDETNINALLELANERDQAFRNRSAIVLALLGHPKPAIGLYRPDESSARYLRQLLRLTEWAISADDLKLAQETAWLAFERAELNMDALYALTLVDEAYRKAGQIPRLLEELTQREPLTDSLLQLKIDLLVDTQRYDEAIRLYRDMTQEAASVAVRDQLLRMYELAGQRDEMVAEYRRLMTDQPHVVGWYGGLASHYINVAAADSAVAVWETFERRNESSTSTLVEGARSMVDMGYVEKAIAMIERHVTAYGPSTSALLFLFDVHFSKGQNEMAKAALLRLRNTLPGGSADLKLVADAYERLHEYPEALDVYLKLQETQEGIGYDEKMRLAWLYGMSGNRLASMQTWQEIWVAENSPARKSYAESQFLLIAAELNVLADIAVELEEKLYTQTANRNEINLLVRIYTEVGDTFTATEVIQEFAQYSGLDEVTMLRQMGGVYLQLSEYANYDGVLRRLIEIDSENRIEHIQNLILNMLSFDIAEDTSKRFGEIQRWLVELREYDAEAVSGEFEASILSMGGFHEDAIESYRRALIEQPSHSDNLLLMADLMKENGQVREAVAILQYVAEHAQDDNEFVVAVDGIINMIGQRQFGDELPSQDRDVFSWTLRTILERIAGRDDKFYLYTLLAEIAQETLNSEGEFLAIENSLSQAGMRRPAVLRELFTMASPSEGFSILDERSGDEERQLTYGRRLIGLRQQLPPSVYISIGKTLLDKGDTLGAEKSFALISDITGSINIDETKASLFDDAGYTQSALMHYSKALASNLDDIGLLLSTAVLRESTGQTEVANALYHRALLNLLRTQPAKLVADELRSSPTTQPFGFRPRVDTSVTNDYRTYFEVLMQGYLATWPTDEDVARRRLRDVRELIDAELSSVAATADENLPLQRYSRLNHAAQFARRVAFSTGDVGFAESMDLELTAAFGDDESTVRSIVDSYRVAGTAGFVTKLASNVEVTTGSIGVEDRLRFELDKEAAAGRIELAVKLARLAGSMDQLESLFDDQIQAGKMRTALAYARSVMPSNQYLRFLSRTIPSISSRPADLLKLIADDASLVLDIEELLQTQLLSADELLNQLNTVATESLNQSLFYASLYGEVSGHWMYLDQHGSVEQKVSYIQWLARQQVGPQVVSRSHVAPYVRSLLRQPLSASDRERLRDIVLDDLRGQDLKDEYQRVAALMNVLQFDVHPENVDVLYSLADEWRTRSQTDVDASSILRNYYAGEHDRVFEDLLTLQVKGILGRGIYDLQTFTQHFSESLQTRVEDLKRGKITDPTLARVIFELKFSRFGYIASPRTSKDAEEEIAALHTLIELFPGDLRYRGELVIALFDLGRRDTIAPALQACYEADPSEPLTRAAYYLWLLNTEDYGRAASVLADGYADLRQPDVMKAIDEQLSRARGSIGANGAELLRLVRGESRSLYFASSRFSPRVNRALENLRNFTVDSGDEVSGHLRSLWRTSLAETTRSGSYMTVDNQVESLLSTPLHEENIEDFYPYVDSRATPAQKVRSLKTLLELNRESKSLTLFEHLAQFTGSATELEVLLTTTSHPFRRGSIVLYDLVAVAYENDADGRTDRMRTLDRLLRSRTLNDHELTLWALLRDQSEETIGPRELAAFSDAFGSLSEPTGFQLLVSARIFAKAGSWEEAVALYELIAAKQIEHGEFVTSQERFISTEARRLAVSLWSILEEAKNRLPREHARRLVLGVLPLARRADNVPQYNDLYDAFVLATTESVVDRKDWLDEAMSVSNTVTQLVSDSLNDATKRIEVARAFVVSGGESDAFNILKPLFQVSSSRESTDGDQSIEARQAQYEHERIAESLRALFGMTVVGDIRFGSSNMTPMNYVINRHERILAEIIAGWQQRLATELIDWLSDTSIRRGDVVELLCVLAYNIDRDRGREAARELVHEISQWFVDNGQKLEADSAENLNRVSIYLEMDVPVYVAERLIVEHKLATADEAQLLRQLAEVASVEQALAVGRAADTRRGKLTVLRELQMLAQAVEDMEYASDLKDRIGQLETAERELDLPSVPQLEVN